MTRLPMYLLGFLCLQLSLSAIIYWQNNQPSALHQPQPLLNFDRDKLDKIVIMKTEQRTTLSKDENSWTLSDLDNLPVNQIQLDSILEKLAALKTNWPIATTRESHQRFELQEDNFQRRIQLFQSNDKVVDLLLGSSPGFRKIHLRTLNDNSVYALPLNTFDFPASNAQWLDKALLAVSNVNAIQGADYRLAKAGNMWILTSLADNKPAPLDQDKATDLAEALSTLRVVELASEPPAFVGSAVKTLVIEDEKQRRYQFLESENTYYIKQHNKDHVFSLSQTDYQRITAVDLSGLVPDKSKAGTEKETQATQ